MTPLHTGAGSPQPHRQGLSSRQMTLSPGVIAVFRRPSSSACFPSVSQVCCVSVVISTAQAILIDRAPGMATISTQAAFRIHLSRCFNKSFNPQTMSVMPVACRTTSRIISIQIILAQAVWWHRVPAVFERVAFPFHALLQASLMNDRSTRPGRFPAYAYHVVRCQWRSAPITRHAHFQTFAAAFI